MSSALTFVSGMTRMETSCGFSVSMSSINLRPSGIRDFGAATMRRLDTLSGQILTWVACAAGVDEDEELLVLGGGVGSAGAPGGRELEDDDEEEEGRLAELEGLGDAGVGGCAVRVKVR